MRLVINTNFDLCAGCLICQLACSEKRTGGYNPRLAMLKINEVREGLFHEPVVCRHCSNPYCMTVCPAEAVEKDEVTGAVRINSEKCTGCGLCVEYCYLGAVFMDKESGKAVKCDLCGGDPACVKECPTGALELVKVGGDSSD